MLEVLTISPCSSVKASCHKKTWKNDFHSLQVCGCHTPLLPSTTLLHVYKQEATKLLNLPQILRDRWQLPTSSTSTERVSRSKLLYKILWTIPLLILHVATVGSMHFSLIGSQAGKTFKCHLIGWWTGCKSSLSWRGDIKIDQDFRTKNSTKVRLHPISFYQKYGSIQSRKNILFKRAANSFRHLGRQVCCLPAVAINNVSFVAYRQDEHLFSQSERNREGQ